MIVREISEAIIQEFGAEMVSHPTDENGWREVSRQFGRRWNLPHVIGAIDGKHIEIKHPRNSHSVYWITNWR